MTAAIFDADSHVMETAEWLPGFADPDVRDKLSGMGLEGAGAGAAQMMAELPALWAGHRDLEIDAEVIRGPKGWQAPGALDTEVRSRVLDALGISVQLVFPTFSLGHFARSKDLDVLYGGTRALNRAMLAFCDPDPRLKAVGYLPWTDPALAAEVLDEAIANGISAIWMPSDAPADFSPAHVDLDPIWARMAEAHVPFVLHVGGGRLLPKAFHNNGLPRPTDWLGGGENLRTKDIALLHFDRHPDLRGAAIELGATWVPGMLRNLDHAHRSFAKFEPAFKALPLLPSEYIRRQVKFTPFPFEDTTWLVEQEGADLFMFSTDYPHPEGGRRPFEIFGDAVAGFDEATRERFFWRNGAELLGL